MASPFTPATIPSARFNGGTITEALTVESQDPGAGSTPFNVTSHTGPVNYLTVNLYDNGSGNVDAALTVVSRGTGAATLLATDPDGYGYCQFATTGGSIVSGRAAFTGDLLAYFVGATPIAKVRHDAGLVLQLHAAPADASLAAGECAFWFDQTNGVGNTKLMVKGKSADGTVKTATILLA